MTRFVTLQTGGNKMDWFSTTSIIRISPMDNSSNFNSRLELYGAKTAFVKESPEQVLNKISQAEATNRNV